MQSLVFSFFAFAAFVVMLSFHVDAQDAPERFRRVDRNGDGRLSRDEVTGPAFDEMDANGDESVLWKKPSRGPEPPDLAREVIVHTIHACCRNAIRWQFKQLRPTSYRAQHRL